MPIIVDTAEEAGVFTSVGVSIEGVGERGEGYYAIDVPPGAAGLIVTITASGPDGVHRVPINAEIRMTSPQEKRVDFGRGEGGQYIFLDNNPEPGRWTLAIAYGPGASIELNATTVQPDWIERLRDLSARFGSWVGCKGCKRLVKALIVAGVIYVGVVNAPAVIAAIPPFLGVILKDDKIRDRFLELLRKYVKEPLDRLAEKICELLGFCPA